MLIEKLEGLKISLNDSNIVEVLTFGSNTVFAIIGKKNGAVCAPILELKIRNETSITINGQGFEINLENIDIKEDNISAIRNGNKTTYIIVEKN